LILDKKRDETDFLDEKIENIDKFYSTNCSKILVFLFLNVCGNYVQKDFQKFKYQKCPKMCFVLFRNSFDQGKSLMPSRHF